jgi:pantothenate kinase
MIVSKHFSDLFTDVQQLILRWKESRIVIGICGGPGVGKSTLALKLVDTINSKNPGSAAYLPMDGFHLSNKRLAQLGMLERKGAIETFDISGYLNVLGNIKSGKQIHVPTYDRTIHDVVPNSIPIANEKVVITEGIFLLSNRDGWDLVRKQLDYCYFLFEDFDFVKPRLLDRQLKKGHSKERSLAHVKEVDEANYWYVNDTAKFADETIRIIY